MFKKCITLILLGLVLALSFAACNRGNDDPPPQQQQNQQQPAPGAETTPAETPGQAEVPTGFATHREFFEADMDGFIDTHFPATDLGGITLRWVGFGNPYSDNEVDAARDQARRERVEQRFNVNLEFIENDDIVAIAGAWGDVPDVMIASIAAGDPIAHLWRGNAGYWFPSLANGGYLRDMDAHLRARLPLSYFEFTGESAAGNAYGFMYGPAYAWNIFVYNRDMIRAVGMEMTPSEMFVAGRWSLDDFYEYLVELNSLLPAEVTAFGAHQTWWMRMASYANGGYILEPRTNVPGLLNEETLEPLRMLQRLVQEGLYIQPGFQSVHDDPPSPIQPYGHWTWGPAFIGGRHEDLFHNGSVAIGNLPPWEFEQAGNNFEFGIVPPPWGSNVTFPGDWRDLKTHTPYRSVFNDGTTAMIIDGTPESVTPEVFVNMVFTWYEERGLGLIENIDAIGGDGIRPLPSSQHLFTQLDRDLWEWYANNSTWEAIDGGGFWILDFSDAWLNTLGGGGDFRVAFERVMPSLVWSLYDLGRLRREHIPEEMWLLASEFGAALGE